jgi:hypothetical protein
MVLPSSVALSQKQLTELKEQNAALSEVTQNQREQILQALDQLKAAQEQTDELKSVVANQKDQLKAQETEIKILRKTSKESDASSKRSLCLARWSLGVAIISMLIAGAALYWSWGSSGPQPLPVKSQNASPISK